MQRTFAKSKILRLTLWTLAGLVLIVVLLPVWMPWIIRPVARQFGAQFNRYERVGYSRFKLSGLQFTNNSTTLRAQTVEAYIPTAWLANRLLSKSKRDFLQADSWDLKIEPARPAAPGPSQSIYTNISETLETVESVRRWIPRARLSDGHLTLPSVAIDIPSAGWSNGLLIAQTALTNGNQIQIRADAGRMDFVSLRADSEPMNLRAGIDLTKETAAVRISGEIFWLTNRLELAAEFGRDGNLPKTATLRSADFRIPASLIRLEQYDALTGLLVADWQTDRFTVNLDATAVPEPASDAAPIVLEARAFGGTESAQIETFRISTPWLRANLTDPTRIQLKPPFFSQPATLEVTANLEGQPWFENARGDVKGRAVFLPSHEQAPRVPFELSGTNVSFAAQQTESLELAGELRWPDLDINRIAVRLPDDSSLEATGNLNVRERIVRNGRARFTGAIAEEWTPPGWSFDGVAVNAEFSGPLLSPTNAVRMIVDDAVIPGFRPMQLDASWVGRGLEIERADFGIAAGESVLHVKGSADLRAGVKANLNVLTLIKSGQTELELQRPAEIFFRAGSNSVNGDRWTARARALRWTGAGGTIELDGQVNWPDDGAVRGTLENLSSRLTEHFLSKPLPRTHITAIKVSGGWTNGPVEFQLEANGDMFTAENVSFTLNAAANGGREGISIPDFAVLSATQEIFSATGFLPVTIEPAGRGLWINPDAEVRFAATTAKNSLLWTKLAERTGVVLARPELSVNVGGAWKSLHGTVAMNVERIEYSRAQRPLPAVEEFHFAAQLDRGLARITQMRALVERQPVALTAELPMTESDWNGLLRERRLPDWRNATARLRIEEAQIAAFSAFAPELLSPQGQVDLNVLVDRGTASGELTIRDARTRPLDSIGPVRDIAAKAVFAGTNVQLENLSAEIGGAPVIANGSVSLTDEFWKTRNPPPFRFHLRGTNVPLARKADLLVRADLDLAITNQASTNVFLTGAVELRESFLLSDLRDLVSGGVNAPKRRPPYFSVETEPLAGWHLNVNVRGDRFLRVQSPLFRGVASTTLRVEGTLKDPVALGEARVNTGLVTFPFGTLDVRQGFVALTSDDPYRPRIYVTAGAQRMGYEIKMEATGAADQPVVQFSSSPPLSSEQIVLMLTAGQVPEGMAGQSTQQRAQGLALFVGKNLLSELGIGGGDGRLSIRSGAQVTESGRPTYDLEYRLNDRWSVLGEYDRFSQYNLGLKWRVYSR